MKTLTASLTLAVVMLAAGGLAAEPSEDGGRLTTAEFPDVVEFDFEKVNDQYQKATRNVGKVTPILDEALSKGQEAVEAGRRVLAEPTDENRRHFVHKVLQFVRGADTSRARITELMEDVRAVHTQTGILYSQATTSTSARLKELRAQYEREELKLRDMVARHKQQRRDKELTEWQLRQLFDQEKRQARTLTHLADRIDFQKDFLAALDRAAGQSSTDFTLYEQFFVEASDTLADIGQLSTNLPTVVKRMMIARALKTTVADRKAVVAGFEKIEKTRQFAQELGQQLLELSSGQLNGQDVSDDEARLLERHTQSYKRWLEGDSLPYRRAPGKHD